jgi:hypothetical protein
VADELPRDSSRGQLHDDVYHRALLRAVELLGGKDRLATKLGVTQRKLDVWLSQRQPPPLDAFLKVTDIIIQFDMDAMRKAHPRKAG